MAGMKAALKIGASFFMALTLLVIGGFIRHPYSCFDCYEAHGFPFTYSQDQGYAGRAAFYRWGMVGDLLVLILLTALIAWGWKRIAMRRRANQT
jgi:hypothetical protein